MNECAWHHILMQVQECVYLHLIKVYKDLSRLEVGFQYLSSGHVHYCVWMSLMLSSHSQVLSMLRLNYTNLIFSLLNSLTHDRRNSLVVKIMFVRGQPQLSLHFFVSLSCKKDSQAISFMTLTHLNLSPAHLKFLF